MRKLLIPMLGLALSAVALGGCYIEGEDGEGEQVEISAECNWYYDIDCDAHCEEFTFIDMKADGKTIDSQSRVPAPEHQPGLLPPWLREQDVDVVIAGGMGHRAQQLLEQEGINVIVGAPSDTPESVVEAYLDGSLQTGENICDH